MVGNKIRLYAVIGGANAGKGTVIRHLSGASKATSSHPYYLSTNIANRSVIRLHIEVSSLQEGVMGRRYSPIDFVAKIAGLQYQPTDILIPLRLNGCNGLQPWSDYISYFQNQAGWLIEGLTFLMNAGLPSLATQNWSQVSSVYQPIQTAHPVNTSNQVAHSIRSQWGWV